MSKIEIIETVKIKMIDGYVPVEKLRTSEYFIQCVRDEIGRTAFKNDYELTVEDEAEIINAVLS